MRNSKGQFLAGHSHSTGRPKGSKNKNGNVLTPFHAQIKTYLEFKLSISAIQKLINPLLEKPISYNSFKYFVEHDLELYKIRLNK